jgi:hypothetical protein
MKDNDDIPTTDTTEFKQLINRVKQGELYQGDALLIEKLLNFPLTIVSPSAKTHIDSANERAPVWNEGEKAGQGRNQDGFSVRTAGYGAMSFGVPILGTHIADKNFWR